MPVAQQLKPGNKKSFRVKGKLDDLRIKGVGLLPMGEGDFIMAVNASMRKALRKEKGSKLIVQIELDNIKPKPPAELIECLKDEPAAYVFFKKLSPSHRNYFGNWVRIARTEETKAKRIAHCVSALSKKNDFGQMMRSIKKYRTI